MILGISFFSFPVYLVGMAGVPEEAKMALFLVALSFLSGLIGLLLLFFGEFIYPMVPLETVPQLIDLLANESVKYFVTTSLSTLIVLFILVIHATYSS